MIREAKPLRLTTIGDDPALGRVPRPPSTDEHLPRCPDPPSWRRLREPVSDGEGRRRGGFTDEDEELTQLLATQAAVAIENTRLYETSTRWLRHLESLSEIGDALTGELELEPLLGLVARRLRTLVNARLVLIALPEPGREGLRIAAADGEGSDAYGLIGMELELGGSKTGRVLQRGRSERVDSVLDDPEIDQQAARRMGVRSALYVPLVAQGRPPIGVVVAHDRLGATSSFVDEDVRLTESLAARAATPLSCRSV